MSPEKPEKQNEKTKSKLSVNAVWQKMITRFLALRHNLVFNCVILFLLAVGVGLLSLLLGTATFGFRLFLDFRSSPILIFLNLAPPVLLVFFVYFLSGRAWIAFTFPSLLVLALSTVQYFKVPVHGDPFIFSDIAVIREVTAIISDITLSMDWRMYFSIFSFTCGILISVFVLKHKLNRVPHRMIAAATVAAVSIGLYSFVYTDTALFNETSISVEGMRYSVARRRISRGFMYSFIHSIHQSVTIRTGIPDWYDEQLGRELAAQFVDVDIPDDQKVNIISIMLESYADLSTFDLLDFKIDVYAPFHSLQEESVSGNIVTNIFAGWTIDTERLFLTGYSQFISYTKNTNSHVHFLNRQGFHTEGFHNGEGWFYDRRAVNGYLGFDRYFFLEDFEDSNRYDSFFFPTVLSLYEARDRSVPYFSYNLSFQNHVGFESAWMLDRHAIEQGDLSDESYSILINYLAGIYDTSWRLAGFIDALRDDPDPVVVVIFGDHLPWLGDGGSVYAELGIDIDSSSEEGFFNRFSTPYLIWANDAAKETVGNDFVGDGGTFSTSFLMGKAFELLSWEGDGQMQAMREFKEYADIVSVSTGFFREDGELTNTLSSEAEAAFRRLRQLEIFRRENFP